MKLKKKLQGADINLSRDVIVVHLSLAHAPFWKFGGLPRIMELYLQGLRGLGWNVGVISLEHNSGLPGLYKSDVQRFYMKPTKWMRRYHFNVNPISVFNIIRKSFRTKKTLILHVSQSRGIFNLVALLVSFMPETKIVFSPFGSLPDRGRFYIRVFDFFITRPFCRRVNLGLAQTSHEQDVMENFGCPKVEIFPLALDSSFSVKASDTQERNVRKFLFLGRFHPTKGVPHLLSIFSKLKQSGYEFELDLVGDDQGDLIRIRSEIDRLDLSQQVRVIPPVYGDERFSLYANYDAFVFRPEVFEETSLASLEALSVGTPIFTTIRADIPHLTEMSAGYVSADDTEYLENLVLFLNMDYPNYIDMRSRAQQTYEDYFESKRSIAALSSHLELIL